MGGGTTINPTEVPGLSREALMRLAEAQSEPIPLAAYGLLHIGEMGFLVTNNSEGAQPVCWDLAENGTPFANLTVEQIRDLASREAIEQ